MFYKKSNLGIMPVAHSPSKGFGNIPRRQAVGASSSFSAPCSPTVVISGETVGGAVNNNGEDRLSSNRNNNDTNNNTPPTSADNAEVRRNSHQNRIPGNLKTPFVAEGRSSSINQHQPQSSEGAVNNVASSSSISCSDLPNLEDSSAIPPVWTPPSAPSPSSQKKFRPVNFNVPGSPKSSTPRTLSLDRSNSSPQLPTRQFQPQQQSQQPRQQLQSSASLTEANFLSRQQQQQQQQPPKEIVSSPDQNDNSSRSDSISVCQTSSGSISVTQNQHSSSQSTTVSLPKYQSPTVTLLQKAREGQLPKGAHYLEQQQQQQSSPLKNIPPPNRPAVSRTVAGLSLDLESNSNSNSSVPGQSVGKRVTDQGVEFEGIGPTTPDGIPIATKPAIQRDQQHQWYKRMYESLHVERPQRRDFMTVKYKIRKGPRQIHGGHSAGHYSEPEGYESDTYAYKYATLDRRKLRDRYSESTTDCLSPSPSTPNSILSPTSSCPPTGIRFTPGRIEDYTPGNSCVIAKEIRKHKPTLQWALGSRDLGYESDSNLIIRKRSGGEDEVFRGIKSPPPPPLSPLEQRQIYVEIQKGGEVPLKGLRKPAPERPKETSWLNLLRRKVRSMPSFDEMKKSVPFGMGRSGSRSPYRSGSPACKSPPPNSTVALLQERIQEKIRRSNSDLTPRPEQSFRSRYGLTGLDASRIIHTVRSTNQIRRAGSSYIPIRSRETSVEKLRVSSPELVSPREVKKAMQTSHRLSIKLEVVKSSPPSSSQAKKGGTEGKKLGLKRNGNGKSSTRNAAASSSSFIKGKSVKISEKISVENDHYRSSGSGGAVTSSSSSSARGGITTNGSNNASIPLKPPRKIKGKETSSSSIDLLWSNKEKAQRVSKVSPVASRHASCLSPHTSRPTSPGSVLSSPISMMTSSATNNNNNTGVNGKSSGSTSEKIMGSDGKFGSGSHANVSTTSTSHFQDSSGGKSSVAKKSKMMMGGSGGSFEGVTATSSGVNVAKLGGTSSASHRKLIREAGGERKKGNGTNRISLSSGKDDRKSPEKEQQQQKSSSSSSKITARKGMVESNKKTSSIRESLENGIERVCRSSSTSNVHKQREIIEHEISSNSNIDLQADDTTTVTATETVVETYEGDSNVTRFSRERERDAMRYWTIPPRKRREDSGSPQNSHHHHYRHRYETSSLERPMSLPALTPYLTETKRVSNSLFKNRDNFPVVRHTKTSAMRQLLQFPATKSEKVNAKTNMIRSISCLTLKEKLIRDYTYTNYILELQNARKKNARFVQLTKNFSSLERLRALERASSLYNISAISESRKLDIETWWRCRNRLRAEEEMSSILNQLMNAQRNREFFFRPKSPEAVRWRGDSSLRCKKWNIDELHYLLTGELFKRKHTSASATDLHKIAWRASGCKETALNIEVASLANEDYYYRDKASQYNKMPALRRALSMSSSLTQSEKEKIKSRLGTLIVKREKGEKEQPSKSSSVNVHTFVKTSRMGLAPASSSSGKNVSDGDHQVVGVDGSLTETAKRQLSKTISEEVQERKMKERESIQRIVEGSASAGGNNSSNNNNNPKSSGESESDSSFKTVIHIPVSTKMLLRKCHEQQQNQSSNLAKGKTPVYSVYCTKGVPSKVTFFETFHKDSNNNKESVPVLISPSEAKIVKTKSYSEKVKARDQGKVKDPQKNATATTTKNTPTSVSFKSDAVTSSPMKATAKTSSNDKTRSHSPTKRSRSVTPEKLTYDNRYMSHINVISKLASLLLKKDSTLKNLVRREVLERDKLERLRMVNAGEVDRLRHYFEDHVAAGVEYDSSFLPEISLLRCLFCSDPNLARLTDKIHLSSNSSHGRRCASADIFKEKLDYFEGDRIRGGGDGKESSPLCRSPELYLSSRSRRPIYQPSSTPNICQPTLTAHCFLESPTKSMEFDTSCYSSDFSGNYWDYHSTSPALSSSTRAAATTTPVVASSNITTTASMDHPNPKSNRDNTNMGYSSIPPRILESRVPPPSVTPAPSLPPKSGSASQELGKNWNYDPAIHQPRYRYVPQPPIIEPRQYYGSSHHLYSRSSLQPGSLPPTLPPPPVPPPPSNYLYQHHQQPQSGRLVKSESFHATTQQSQFAPQLYRSVRYWNPNTPRGAAQSAREYHPRPGLHNVGLPLQRSSSLNYGHHHQQQRTTSTTTSPVTKHAKSTSTEGLQKSVESQNSTITKNNTCTKSTSTDIDNEIRLIETQFDNNSHNHSNHNDDERTRTNLQSSVSPNSCRSSSVGDVISIAVPVLNSSSSADTTTTNSANANAAARRNASQSSPVKYAESEVNIHYKAPVRFVEKEFIGEEELRRRQEIRMIRFYEEQRQRKLLQEIQDMENRRHMDNFTPSQKSPIPLNRYDDVIDELPKRWGREKTPEPKLAARALYNFIAQNGRELSFSKGDILFIRRKVDSNWYEGEHNAAVGIFPCSYVETLPAYDIERATPRTITEGQAKVCFNFTAATPAEMSIIKGETVVLTRKVDQNWYEGRIGTRHGIFPKSFIQVIREPGLMDYMTNSSSSAKSPKPIGAPAAHSLLQNGGGRGGLYNPAKHSYKPNEYSFGTDLSNIDAYMSAHSSIPHSPSGQHHNNQYRKENIFQQHHNHHSNINAKSQSDPGRNRYAQNLTIDTRIEPIPYRAVYNYKPAHEDELELREGDLIHVLEKCDDGWFVGSSNRTGLFGTFPGNYVEHFY